MERARRLVASGQVQLASSISSSIGSSGAVLAAAQSGSSTQRSRTSASDRRQEERPALLVGSTQQLGTYLFNHQAINMELAGLILTVAMVGAIIIARRKVWHETAEGRDLEEGGEVVLGPATPLADDPHSIPVYGTRNPRQKEYPEK